VEKARQYSAVRALVALAAGLAVIAAGEAHASDDTAVWGLQVTDGVMALMYGTPETDDLRLEFTCRLGSGEVSIWAPLSSRERLRLRSEGQDHTYPSFHAWSAMVDDGERTASTRVNDPVLRAFARSGVIRLSGADAYAARSPEERQAVASFFEGCGG
jgi:hypothetical protein